jgi:hypothetical protein
MGRKRKEAAEPAKQNGERGAGSGSGDGAKPVNKKEAVKRALAEGLKSHEEAAPYIKTRFNIDIAENTFNSYKSTLNREEGGRATGRKTRTPAAPSNEPTLSDLFKVRELLDDDVGAVVKQMAALKTLADAVGGFDRLAACLDALAKLSAS